MSRIWPAAFETGKQPAIQWRNHDRPRPRVQAGVTQRAFASPSHNVMSVLFNHGLRHELIHRNPVQWVRQSAKRKKIPAVLEIEEVRSLLGALAMRERTMVCSMSIQDSGQANCLDSSGPISTSPRT